MSRRIGLNRLRSREYNIHEGRQRHPLQERYVEEAIKELKYVTECSICKKIIENKKFLEHIKECAQKFNVSFDKEAMVENQFRASRFSTNQSLALLRERMEIGHFEATLDKGKMTCLDCTLCPTLQYHLDGGCIEDNQRQTFKEEGARTVQWQLSHFIDACHYEMQVGLQEIEDNFEDSTKNLFDEPSLGILMDIQRIEILAEIDRNKEQEIQKQKNEYTAKKQKETIIKINQFQDRANKMYLRYMKEMVEYIKTNKNKNNLAEILEFRKRNSLQDAKNEVEKPKRGRRSRRTEPLIFDPIDLDSSGPFRVPNSSIILS